MSILHRSHGNAETDREKFEHLQEKLQDINEKIEECHQYRQAILDSSRDHYMAKNASYEYWDQRMGLLVAEREKILAKVDDRAKRLADTALGSR